MSLFGGQLICTSLSLLFLVFPHVYIVVLFGKLFGSKSHQIVISHAFLAVAKEDRKRRGVGRGVLDYTCTMASDGLKVGSLSYLWTYNEEDCLLLSLVFILFVICCLCMLCGC